MASIRAKRVVAIGLALGTLGIGGAGFAAWRLGLLFGASPETAPAIESTQASSENVVSMAPAKSPIGEIFPSLTGETLLPRFQPCIQNVDWEFLLSERFEQGGKSYAVAVFANYRKDETGKRFESHALGADLVPALFASEPNGGWRCIEFKSEFTQCGSYGNVGEVKFCRLGPDRWGLCTSGSYTAQGETTSGSSYFELGDSGPGNHPPTLALKEIFQIRESLESALQEEQETPEEDWKSKTTFTEAVVNGHFVINFQIEGRASAESLEAAGDYEFSPKDGTYVKTGSLHS